MSETGGTRAALAGAALSAALLALTGCGGDKFDREPRRPPVAVQLGGVIQPSRVTVQPNRLGAGPIVLIVSNQTQQSHSVILEGPGLQERTGPVNPNDTATLQATLRERGTYRVRAGSERAVAQEIEPATLEIGAPRRTAEDELELP